MFYSSRHGYDDIDRRWSPKTRIGSMCRGGATQMRSVPLS